MKNGSKIFDNVDDALLKFAVIISVYDGKYIFCKHKERSTLEIAGGHRENGELIDDTAKRELYEETGATEYNIQPVCIYAAVRDGVSTYGKLYFADVKALETELKSEIECVFLLKELPTLEKWTYPNLQYKMLEEAKKRGFINF